MNEIIQDYGYMNFFDEKINYKSLGEKGFSFLELMVVVVILGILATYIAPRFMGRAEDAKAVKAKVDIVAIETSLKLYKLDNSNYPTTEQGILALIEKPSTEPVPMNWKEKGYLEKARIPKDPWGRRYYILVRVFMMIMILSLMVPMVLLAGKVKTKILTAGSLNKLKDISGFTLIELIVLSASLELFLCFLFLF